MTYYRNVYNKRNFLSRMLSNAELLFNHLLSTRSWLTEKRKQPKNKIIKNSIKMLSELSRREMYHRQHDANKVSYYK